MHSYISLLLSIYISHILVNFQCSLFPKIVETDLSSYVRVSYAGNKFNVVCSIHAQKLKTFRIQKSHGILKTELLRHIQKCNPENHKSLSDGSKISPQDISFATLTYISRGFGHGIQVDLIDMRNCPDIYSKYIWHMMDHFTKFHVLFP